MRKRIIKALLTAAVLALAVTADNSVTALASGPHPASTPLRLHPVIVRDPMVNNIEAFRFLAPVGWQTAGGVQWRHQQSNLATVAMRVWNPTGSESLEVFPVVPMVWSQSGIAFFPPGSTYLGNEVRMPLEPPAYVQQVIIPRHRAQVNPRLLGATPLPAVAEAVAPTVQEPGMNKQVHAAKVRLEYMENGRAMEEDMYVVLVYAASPMMPGFTLWTADRLYSFKAAKGTLDEASKTLQAIATSVQPNLEWFAQYQQVVQLWQQGQMQSIRQAGELSRYLAQTNKEISAMIREGYEQRQAAQDRTSASFSQYIRGVESYKDPTLSRSVELPSGYRDVWRSTSGEYLLSNEAGFNPNVGSTQSWTRLEQVK
jgi:hypothetical protein